MSHRQFFSVAELPPTIAGDSGRGLTVARLSFWKAYCFWEQRLKKKKNVSKCHHLLTWTQLQTKPTLKRNRTKPGSHPITGASRRCLPGTTYWSATWRQPALKHFSTDPLPSNAGNFIMEGWLMSTPASINQFPSRLWSRVSPESCTHPLRTWLPAVLRCWCRPLRWTQR